MLLIASQIAQMLLHTERRQRQTKFDLRLGTFVHIFHFKFPDDCIFSTTNLRCTCKDLDIDKG